MELKREDDFLDDDNIVDDEIDINETDNYEDFGDYGSSLAPIDKYKDLLKGLTDFESFLKQIIAEWVGLIWDNQKQEYVLDKSIKPIMNYKCAKWCITFLRPYARSNNLLTQLRKDEYNDMMDDIEETAILSIGTRAQEFGLNSNSDIKLVYNQLIHISELVLLGAGGDKNYKDFFQRTVNRSEHQTITPPQPIEHDNVKRGIFLKGIRNIMQGGQ